MDPLFVALEIGAATFFLTAAWLALRRGRLPVLELVSAALFGLLLEEGDQLIFGTYEYSASFVLGIDRAPIVIGLTWALILTGVMRITDALGVRRRWAPFVDSVLAIMLDLAFDAIATRMGLWTWRDYATGTPIPLDAGWFGVPAGNFYAWLFVTFGFSLLTRWLRDGVPRGSALEWLQLLVPIPAYAILLFGLGPYIVLQPLVDPSLGGGMPIFLVAFAAFVIAAGWGVLRPAPAGRAVPTSLVELRMAFAVRIIVHLFFVVGLIVIGLGGERWILLLVALALLAAEVPLASLVAARVGTASGFAPPDPSPGARAPRVVLADE